MGNSYCASCATPLPAGALSCQQCHQLVHAARLEELVQQARTAEATDPSEALRLWREALALLPADAKQAAYIRERIAEIGAKLRVGETPQTPPSSGSTQPPWLKRLGPFGAALGALWKFKGLAFLLTKGKFLILGLGKFQTLFSMLASMALYWGLFGWRFAVGFILGIYIHEMGHVWEMRRFGLRASAPMFIPGFGAFISLYDSPANAHEDARIGLAGPIWGAGAAAFFAIVAFATDSQLWYALARSTATINLFNLTPVWQLDGGRALRALAYPQRLMLAVLFLALWLFTGESLFVLLLLGIAYRIFWLKDHHPDGDQTILIHFSGLAILFGMLHYFIALPGVIHK